MSLYTASAHGSYADFGMTPQEFEEQASKRIERLLETEEKRASIDSKTIGRIKGEYKDRLKRFEKFSSEFSPKEREEVLKVVKEKGISLEKAAYSIRGDTSRN